MKSWRTTLSGLVNLFLLGLWFYALLDTETLVVSAVLANSWGFISAADADKLKRIFQNRLPVAIVALGAIVLLSSCTRHQLSTFFHELGNEVPIQKVSYTIPKPDKDTTIIYYAPYKIFKNTAVFQADSIGHSEEFNWSGLGDFLWIKLQERKERRQNKTKVKNEQSFLHLPRNNLYRLPMKDLYLSLTNRLKTEVPDLKLIDLYNNQFEREDKEHPIALPCVLIELGDVPYSRNKQGIQQGTVTLTVHIGQDLYQDTYEDSPEQAQALAVLDLNEAVYLALQDFSGDRFSSLERVLGQFSSNYDNMYVHRIAFKTTYTDDSKAQNSKYQKIEPDIVPKREGIDA